MNEREELLKYLKKKTNHFMEIDYHNIINGFNRNELGEFYDNIYICKVIEYFEKLEQYERCNVLKKIIDERC